MIAVLIGLGIFGYGIYSGVRDFRSSRRWGNVSWFDVNMPIIFGAIFGFVALLVVSAILSTGLPRSTYVAETTPLHAVSAGSEVDGSFFLLAGTIDEEQVYQYIVKRDDGALLLDSIEADRAVVFEGEESTPVLLRIERDYEGNFWVWDVLDGDLDEYQFHIPTGSVVQNYNIDISNNNN